MEKCADKIDVREYVRSCGFGSCLNDVFGVYSKINDIDVRKLPSKFVIKAAHGSHMNIIVKDKKEINWFKAKLMMQSWLMQDIYWSGREWVYKNLKKRILVEKYLEDESGELRDYKFFCFNGEPCYMQYDCGRYSGRHIRNYYDMDLKLLSIQDSMTEMVDVGLPLEVDSFKKMKNIAKTLSSPFQFVRVDLYLVKQHIYFGEMTFFDGGGYSGFDEETDMEFGKKWKLI